MPAHKSAKIWLNGSLQSSFPLVRLTSDAGGYSQTTDWIPLYYLQSALKEVGVKTTWTGSQLIVTPKSGWHVNQQGATSPTKLPNTKMEFVVSGHAYVVSSRKVITDPRSGKPTTYIPVDSANQFISQNLPLQAYWGAQNWSIDTPSVLVPQDLLKNVMTNTSEKNDAQEHFMPFPFQVVVSDGHGGYLSAVGASRFPTADGLGQLLFFFHNGNAVGLNADVEVTAINSIVPDGPGRFTVTYANYKPTDPMVNPTLPPQTVTYSWNGQTFVPSAPLEPGVDQGEVQVVRNW